jgi:hypothetical protein
MLPDYTGRPVEDFTRDEFINFIGGDCYGDPMKFSGLRCQFLINEQVTPCIKVIADPAWNLDGSLHDFGYCAHIPEEELMSFLVGLGYTITFVEPPVGEKTAWAPLNQAMLDQYSHAELAGAPDRYRKINGRWHYKVLVDDSAGRSSGTIDPEEHGIIQE